MKDLNRLAKGLKMVLGAALLTILLAVVETFIDPAPLASHSPYAGLLKTITSTLGLVGLAMCLAAPVGRGLVLAACLAQFIDVIAGSKMGGLGSGLASFLFLVFLYQLGQYLRAERVCKDARAVFNLTLLALLPFMALVGAPRSPLSAFCLVIGLGMLLGSFLFYFRAQWGAIKAIKAVDDTGHERSSTML